MNPMNTDVTAAGEQVEGERVYLSCSAEDLIAVEMEAWKRGCRAAEAAGPEALQSLEAVSAKAEDACNQALLMYVPLDVGRFADVFVRGWCAGYCTRARELSPQATPPVTH
jgi:hypothetical protein